MESNEIISLIDKYLLPVLGVIVAGVFAHLVRPYIDFSIEKKRQKRTDRKQLFSELRTYLSNNKIRSEDFLNSNNYLEIRDLLSPVYVEELEKFDTTVLISSFRDYYKTKFFEELNRIEYESLAWWKRIFKKRKNKSYRTKEKGFTVTVEENK
jgi:hypothetical protein